MRNLILLFAALLVAGCGEKSLSDSAIKKALEEAVEFESLQERNDLYYQVNESEPYSGWVKDMYDSGQAKGIGRFKDGKPDGPAITWYENGQKENETTFKDGEPDGLWTSWYENGQKDNETTFKDGKEDGPCTAWHENGQKKYEATFKDGKEDGPFTECHDNGQKAAEGTYKDGEGVSVKYWNSKGEEVAEEESWK